jgi:CRP-like cAMP-binding protein
LLITILMHKFHLQLMFSPAPIQVSPMSLEAGCAAHLAPRPAHATTEHQHSAAIARVMRMALPEPLSAAEEAVGQRSRFAQHIHLFREGDPASHVYQLTEGAVMLYKLLPDGRRSIVEVLINTGDVFGLSSSPLYDCSAETLVAGGAISFDRATITSSPELSRRIAARLQAQFCAMHEHAALLGRKTALERVASFVMRCVPGRGGYDCPGPEGKDDSTHVKLAMTREEIADYLGLTLETVSRAFSELRRRGVLTTDRHGQLNVNDVCRICGLTGAH